MSKLVKAEREIAERLLAEFDDQPGPIVRDRIDAYARLYCEWSKISADMRLGKGAEVYRASSVLAMLHKQLEDHAKSITSALGQKKKRKTAPALARYHEAG